MAASKRASCPSPEGSTRTMPAILSKRVLANWRDVIAAERVADENVGAGDVRGGEHGFDVVGDGGGIARQRAGIAEAEAGAIIGAGQRRSCRLPRATPCQAVESLPAPLSKMTAGVVTVGPMQLRNIWRPSGSVTKRALDPSGCGDGGGRCGERRRATTSSGGWPICAHLPAQAPSGGSGRAPAGVERGRDEGQARSRCCEMARTG